MLPSNRIESKHQFVGCTDAFEWVFAGYSVLALWKKRKGRDGTLRMAKPLAQVLKSSSLSRTLHFHQSSHIIWLHSTDTRQKHKGQVMLYISSTTQLSTSKYTPLCRWLQDSVVCVCISTDFAVCFSTLPSVIYFYWLASVLPLVRDDHLLPPGGVISTLHFV